MTIMLNKITAFCTMTGSFWCAFEWHSSLSIWLIFETGNELSSFWSVIFACEDESDHFIWVSTFICLSTLKLDKHNICIGQEQEFRKSLTHASSNNTSGPRYSCFFFNLRMGSLLSFYYHFFFAKQITGGAKELVVLLWLSGNI